jgi:hypothetical protein
MRREPVSAVGLAYSGDLCRRGAPKVSGRLSFPELVFAKSCRRVIACSQSLQVPDQRADQCSCASRRFEPERPPLVSPRYRKINDALETVTAWELAIDCGLDDIRGLLPAYHTKRPDADEGEPAVCPTSSDARIAMRRFSARM